MNNNDNYSFKIFLLFCFVKIPRVEKKKGLKACLLWKVHLAYPASLQARHSNTWKQIIQMQHDKIKNPNWQEATS